MPTTNLYTRHCTSPLCGFNNGGCLGTRLEEYLGKCVMCGHDEVVWIPMEEAEEDGPWMVHQKDNQFARFQIHFREQIKKLQDIKAIPVEDTTGCKHESVLPKFDWEVAQTMTPYEVRKQFPRFSGVCPDCDEKVIVYASYEHYLSGDW